MLPIVLLAAAAAGPVPVPVLLAHLRDWNGRQVEVRGWVHGCGASVANLSGRCYITPSETWRQGRDLLKLVAFPRPAAGLEGERGRQVFVRGFVEEDKCPSADICLDRESDLRVDAVGRARP